MWRCQSVLIYFIYLKTEKWWDPPFGEFPLEKASGFKISTIKIDVQTHIRIFSNERASFLLLEMKFLLLKLICAFN